MAAASNQSKSSKTPRRRRTAEETRRLLLEAGTKLVLDSLTAQEAGDGGPLAHIRVQDVVKEASEDQPTNVTTGALYNIWPTQRAYQVDLMFHLIERGAYPSAVPVERLAAELFAARRPFEEIADRLSDESFRLEAASPEAQAAAAFNALAGVPAIRDALRSGHATLIESARALYTQLLAYGGLRMRDPYSIEQLITVVGALNSGLLETYRVVPELFDVPDGTRSLAAIADEAVFRAFCEPVDEESRRSK